MAKRKWMTGVLATDRLHYTLDPWVLFWQGATLGDVSMDEIGLWWHRTSPRPSKQFRSRTRFLEQYKGLEPPAPGEAFEVELEI